MKKLLIAIAILTALCYTLLPSIATELPTGQCCQPKVTLPPIRVANYTDGATIRHPVPLIRGTLTDAGAASVTIVNTSSTRSTRKMKGLAHNGNFKVLTELVPGPNRLLIKAGEGQLALTLNYSPQTNPHIVRVFYLTDKTGDTKYQTPIENDPQNYADKLGTAMKLMQTFTAERMHDLGFGRVTFNLELDEDGRVKVHTLQAQDTAEHYHKMDGLKLWQYAGRLIRRKHPNPNAKNLVIPAFTRFDAETGKPCAHTALGGGSLALFGGANIFTWPDSLADVQTAFADTTRIDTTRFFSDSVGRHTFWAAASTTSGAALHELGHTFGLPHSQSPQDIMTRGFDRFNRAFTFVEPPHARRKEPYEFTETQVARWEPPSAAWLKFNPWFALDNKDFAGRNSTTVTADDNMRTIRISSDNGIGAIVLGPKGTSAGNVPIDYNRPPPNNVSVPMAEFGRYLSGPNAQIRVLDARGLATTVPLADLMPRAFVRAWRFASISPPWDDPKSFVPVDEKALKAIAESAASTALATSPTPYMDFLPHFPNEKRQNIAGYVARTFTADKPRDIRIFTGSDDALRVWLNGELIIEKLLLRSAAIDAESADARLREGQNTIIAEVSQRTGGWGLYLRITDNKHNDLILTDDNKITQANIAK